MGCSTPSSATDAVRLARASSSKLARGWCGFGAMDPTGTSLSPVPGSAPVMSVGMRAPRPLPSPLRRPTAHLLGQLAIGDRAPRARIERDDRLPEGGGLRQSNGARHDVPAHLV